MSSHFPHISTYRMTVEPAAPLPYVKAKPKKARQHFHTQRIKGGFVRRVWCVSPSCARTRKGAAK